MAIVSWMWQRSCIHYRHQERDIERKRERERKMKIETHYVEELGIKMAFLFKEMETKTHYKEKLEVKEMCKTQKENKIKDP